MQKKYKKCRYENSIGKYIEKDLKLDIMKVWDFEKNIISPYEISRGSHLKIWVKCLNRGYHDSYQVQTYHFTNGQRCSFCSNKKVHPNDSFAQYHIDNTDPDFLEKYWDYEKNTVDPFAIKPNFMKKIFIKCQKNVYHDSYEISGNNFFKGKRCGYCHPSGEYPKVNIYDSFGYHNFDKVQSWHPDNNISPFKITRNSTYKALWKCPKCMNVLERRVRSITVGQSIFCSKCMSSKGEIKIISILNNDNIQYVYDKPYFKDLLSESGNPLRPDFILPEKKIWIEYDGEFHYKDIYKDGSYERLKYNDKLKDEYAKEHGWKMIRIPYWEFDNIENILRGCRL